MDWQALILTLKLDLVVCDLLMLIGVPLAFWLAFWQWRWKFLVEAVVALPLVLPPRLSGFSFCSHLARTAPSEKSMSASADTACPSLSKDSQSPPSSTACPSWCSPFWQH